MAAVKVIKALYSGESVVGLGELAPTDIPDFSSQGLAVPTQAGADAANAVGAASGASTAEKLRTLMPAASTSGAGKVALSAGTQDSAKAVSATGAEIAALLAAAGITTSPATGNANLDNIGDGTTRKAVTAAEKTALAAGFSQVSRLAAAEVTQTLWDFAKARQLPTNLLREMVESASMGMFTVIVDDLGYPSMMMVCRPVMGGHIHEDFGGTTYPDDVFPSHLVGGVFKPEIYLAPFNAREYTDGSGARAVVWPGLFPTTSKTFDQEKTLCTAKGSGWHMMTFWENAYLMWMSMKNNTEPRGNTYYGRSHESGYEYESGVRSDLLFPGTASGTAATRGGSGPSSWSHNRERWGIHDLVGNVWRRLDGMKIVDGLIYLPDDNNYPLAEASWPAVHGSSAQAVYFDNTAATTGGAPRLSSARDNALVDPNYSTVAHSTMTMTAGYDALHVTARRKMLEAGLAMRLTQAGSNPFNLKGTVYLKNYGERVPLAGGDWTSSSFAGLAALDLGNARSYARSFIGFRPAFVP